jgi:hypothetical protein
MPNNRTIQLKQQNIVTNKNEPVGSLHTSDFVAVEGFGQGSVIK